MVKVVLSEDLRAHRKLSSEPSWGEKTKDSELESCGPKVCDGPARDLIATNPSAHNLLSPSLDQSPFKRGTLGPFPPRTH